MLASSFVLFHWRSFHFVLSKLLLVRLVLGEFVRSNSLVLRVALYKGRESLCDQTRQFCV